MIYNNFREDYTMENFIIGNNRKVFNIVLSLLNKPEENTETVLILGKTGFGKTHLLQAIGNHFRTNKEERIIYTTAEQFTNEYLNSIVSNESEKFLSNFLNIEKLLFEDLQYLEGKTSTQDIFLKICKQLLNQRKYVFISCGKPLNKLQYFNKDLNEFLTSGKIIKLQRPNLKAREIFIKKRLNYDEDVIEYIARNFKGSYRDLDGIINKINAYKELKQEKISMNEIKELL